MTLLFLVAACNKSRPEMPPNEKDEEDTGMDFYWVGGERIPIIRSEDKSFVLFRSSDREALLSSLSAKGVETDNSKIYEYRYGGTDMSGEAAYSLIDHQWAEVNINHKSAYEIPEVVYAAPYYSLPNDNYEFPLTNLVYVYLKNAGGIKHLEKLAKEYNVGIIGEALYIPLWYLVSCTKESKGNALEVANSFYESGLFEGAEPAFISFRQDGTH